MGVNEYVEDKKAELATLFHAAPRRLASLRRNNVFVSPRQLPGALVLGLLASLVAHAAIFGGEHAMGGAYNGLLVQLALVGALGISAALAAVAWGEAGRIADGSVLVARIGERLPALPALLGATCFWFALGERIEPEHAAASLLLTLLCLVVSAVLLGLAVRFTLRLLVGVTFTVSRPRFSGRSPAWVRRTQQQPITLRSPLLRRRFARPPPIANARA